MFEGTKDTHITKIHCVLDMSWKKKLAHANPRPFHALSIRLDGDSRFIHSGTEFRVARNDILFMPKNYSYDLDARADEHIICMHFDADGDALSEPDVFRPINPAIFRKYFLTLRDIAVRKQPGYEYALLSVSYSILENIAVQKEQMSVALFDASKMLAPVIQYMNENFRSPELSVTELAGICGISETYFRRLFKSVTQMTPKEYLGKLRLDYARELLQSGYYTVKETALICGVPNTKYFSTYIRKKTGSKPSELREPGTHAD